MAPIPRAAQILATGRPEQIHKLLIAAILRAEDDMLTISEEDLQRADGYSLITTDIPEEKVVVLTVRAK